MAKQTVDLISSGYEWTCPECDSLNKEIEITDHVRCSECEWAFETNPAGHAYG